MTRLIRIFLCFIKNIGHRNRYKDIDISYLSCGSHTLPISGGELQYCIFETIEPGSIVPVFFHGALNRSIITLPYFEGANLCKKYKMAGIAFFDPTLEMSDSCTLAWYLGNDRYTKLQREIHDFLEIISKKWDITFVFHGGSGGGFAALVQKSYFPHRHFAVVQNPQTNVLSYYKSHRNKYFSTYENPPAPEQHHNQFKRYKIQYAIRSNQLTDILYFQNRSDFHHINNHLKPFLNKKYTFSTRSIDQKDRNNHFFIGNWGDGHIVMPREVVGIVLQSVVQNRSFAGIEACLSEADSLHLLSQDQYKELL